MFDLLRLQDKDLTRRLLEDRRAHLEEMFAQVAQPSVLILGWQTTEVDQAREWFDALVAVGVEGLVIKDARQSYRPGRRDWLKLKNRVTTEAIVDGVIGCADRPQALILGRHAPDTGRLQVVGRTVNLPRNQQDELGALLQTAKHQPVARHIGSCLGRPRAGVLHAGAPRSWWRSRGVLAGNHRAVGLLGGDADGWMVDAGLSGRFVS